jgi:hypothetical protein
MYTAVILGAPPNFLERSGIAQHRQTWKLQEHHLLRPAGSPAKRIAPFTAATPSSSPDAHSALTGYLAPDLEFEVPQSEPYTLRVTLPGDAVQLVYHTWTDGGYVGVDPDVCDWTVDDIIISGQVSQGSRKLFFPLAAQFSNFDD